MPWGGDICLSMLPIFLYSCRWGVRPGMMSGLILGVITFILDGGICMVVDTALCLLIFAIISRPMEKYLLARDIFPEKTAAA